MKFIYAYCYFHCRYQFNPVHFQLPVVSVILLKALTNLPHSDYTMCKCLIDSLHVSVNEFSIVWLAYLIIDKCFAYFDIPVHLILYGMFTKVAYCTFWTGLARWRPFATNRCTCWYAWNVPVSAVLGVLLIIVHFVALLSSHTVMFIKTFYW